MPDPRFQMPVNGVPVEQLSAKLRAAINAVGAQFPPRTGIAVFVFDFGDAGGMAYGSNAERTTMHEALREYLDKHQHRA